jgi:hypothetical protein
MKHHHTADINVNVELPTQDLEDLIDKATEAVITIIVAYTAAHLLKSIFD